MKDAQKPDHISLNTLIGRLREGRFVIPDFQREFEWKPWDVRDLMRSVFLDYYIGSLLLWKGKSENFTALSCERIYGAEGEGTPEYIVLDGQQRGGDTARLPSHVNQKVEERLAAAAKKNAAIDLAEYYSLDRHLEFCDLRELQDTVLSKAIRARISKNVC